MEKEYGSHITGPKSANEPVPEEMPKDENLAELVDMGFPAVCAEIALRENGGDVQHAIDSLLAKGHEQGCVDDTSPLPVSHGSDTNVTPS
jgi:hypothetical protein